MFSENISSNNIQNNYFKIAIINSVKEFKGILIDVGMKIKRIVKKIEILKYNIISRKSLKTKNSESQVKIT